MTKSRKIIHSADNFQAELTEVCQNLEVVDIKMMSPIILTNQPEKGNQRVNELVYKELAEQFPFIKLILEDFCSASVEYGIHGIWIDQDKYNNRVVFYFYQSFTCYFVKPELIKLAEEHKVGIQVPGNQDYTYSISMHF